MAIKHAEILDDDQYATFVAFVQAGNFPMRDTLIAALSYKAGLRVQEIAMLRWEHVCDATGRLRDTIFIGSDIGKYGQERSIPMHPDLMAVLVEYRRQAGKIKLTGRVVHGAYKSDMTPNSLCVWFHRIYQKAGLHNCSSHSGRRTFLTKGARTANLHGCSLKDVQFLAGHAKIETTETYIELSAQQRKFVGSL